MGSVVERQCGCQAEFDRFGRFTKFSSCGTCAPPVLQLGLALSASVTEAEASTTSEPYLTLIPQEVFNDWAREETQFDDR